MGPMPSQFYLLLHSHFPKLLYQFTLSLRAKKKKERKKSFMACFTFLATLDIAFLIFAQQFHIK